MFVALCCVLALMVLYVGEVVALIWDCEWLPSIRRGKRYVWQIPILNVLFFFKFLGEGEYGLIRNTIFYLIVPYKNLMILRTLVEVMEQQKSLKTPVKAEYRDKAGRRRAYRREAAKRYTEALVMQTI